MEGTANAAEGELNNALREARTIRANSKPTLNERLIALAAGKDSSSKVVDDVLAHLEVGNKGGADAVARLARREADALGFSQSETAHRRLDRAFSDAALAHREDHDAALFFSGLVNAEDLAFATQTIVDSRVVRDLKDMLRNGFITRVNEHARQINLGTRPKQCIGLAVFDAVVEAYERGLPVGKADYINLVDPEQAQTFAKAMDHIIFRRLQVPVQRGPGHDLSYFASSSAVGDEMRADLATEGRAPERAHASRGRSNGMELS